MDLPKHIANMCGILDHAVDKPVANTQPEFAAITKDKDGDGAIQIRYRGNVIGWINDVATESRYKYRALTSGGQIKHFFTQPSAMNWLIEEAF